MRENDDVYILKNLKRCNKFLFEFKKSYVIIVIIVSIIQGILPAVSLTLRKSIINNLQIRYLKFDQFLSVVLIYIGLSIASIIIDYFYSIYNASISANFDNFIKLKVLDKATTLTLKNFEDSETFNIINRAKTQSGVNILNFYSSFMYIIRSLIKIITTIIIVSEFSIYLIPVIIILPFIRFLFYLKINKVRYEFQKRRTIDNRILWYIEHLLLTGNAFKEIKLLNISTYLIQRFKSTSLDIIQENLSIIKKTGKINAAISIADQMLTGGILTYILIKGFNGKLLIGDAIAYNDGLITIKREIENVLQLISGMAENALNLNFLFDFLNLNLESEKIITNKIKIDKIEKISLRNVNYSYSGSNIYVLKDINLNIYTNKIIGIVGKNGAGKSTLIKIIMGFYEDYEGEIYVNGINLRLIDKESYTNRIRCVFQDYIKFEMSIRENIGFGNVKNIHNDSEIKKCLDDVNFDEILYKKNGLDTIIGSWFGSKDISIGQWQRIAIARAIFGKADLYIFDEPDASLDLEAEFKMIKLYKKILSGQLGIVISHKVNHIKYLVDEIIVINNHTIEDIGNHEELIKKDGTYSDLYNAQNT